MEEFWPLQKGGGAIKHPDLGLKALPPIELDSLKGILDVQLDHHIMEKIF